MSEQFNQELSLSGKIPTGHFNTAFEFTGGWQKDAANTKALAFDGISITLYTIALDKSQVLLRDHVKQAVPSSWDPAALARWTTKQLFSFQTPDLLYVFVSNPRPSLQKTYQCFLFSFPGLLKSMVRM